MCRRTPPRLERRCQLADSISASNTTLGRIVGHAPELVPLESSHATIPSAIFFEQDGGAAIGRKAIDEYVAGSPGRLMRSLEVGARHRPH